LYEALGIEEKEKATVSKKAGKRVQTWATGRCFVSLDLLEIPFYTRANRSATREEGRNV
jgi:hypothetical protein